MPSAGGSSRRSGRSTHASSTGGEKTCGGRFVDPSGRGRKPPLAATRPSPCRQLTSSRRRGARSQRCNGPLLRVLLLLLACNGIIIVCNDRIVSMFRIYVDQIHHFNPIIAADLLAMAESK
jgi:hypothetical protein